MSCTMIQQTNKNLLLAILAVACGLSTISAAQVTPPATPDAIAPPAGNTAFLVGHARGSQGYICLPTRPVVPLGL